MSTSDNPSKPASAHPNYGLDAPNVIRNFFLIGAAGLAIYFACAFIPPASWLKSVKTSALVFSIVFGAQGFIMLWGSKSGKLHLRDRLIASLPWRGDESVLDVGCGHGLMLIAAANKLRTGKAIGIDLWQTEDQAGNSRDATWQNVQIENVSDRVQLQDGDARQLPFPDQTFDVILSSWALHNIYDAAGRASAFREIARVLKSGGHLTIVDIRHAAEYAQVLRDAGLCEVHLSRPNFLFVIPSHTVTARKP